MKVVFLTLLLGLFCVAQEEEAEQSVSELSGYWSTAYIASKNLDIRKAVSLRQYRYYIVFCEKCIIIIVYVYDSKYDVWRPLTFHAIPIGPYIYTYKYKSTYRIEFTHVSKKALVAIHVDETGKEPEQVLLFGKENDFDKEDITKFKEEIDKWGITEENIKDLTKPDECLSVA